MARTSNSTGMGYEEETVPKTPKGKGAFNTNQAVVDPLQIYLQKHLGTDYTVHEMTHDQARDSFLVSISRQVNGENVNLSFSMRNGGQNMLFNQGAVSGPNLELITKRTDTTLPNYVIGPVAQVQAEQAKGGARVTGVKYLNPADVVTQMVRASYDEYEQQHRYRADYDIQQAWMATVQGGVHVGTEQSGQYAIPAGWPLQTGMTGPSEERSNRMRLGFALSFTNPQSHPGPITIQEMQDVQAQLYGFASDSFRPGVSGGPNVMGWDQSGSKLGFFQALAAGGYVLRKPTDEGSFGFYSMASGYRVNEAGEVENYSTNMRGGHPVMKGLTLGPISGRNQSTPLDVNNNPIAASEVSDFWNQKNGQPRDLLGSKYTSLNMLLPGEDRSQNVMLSMGILALGYPAPGGGAVYEQTFTNSGMASTGIHKVNPVGLGANVRDIISGSSQLDLNTDAFQSGVILGDTNVNAGSFNGNKIGFRTTAGALSVNKINLVLPKSYDPVTGDYSSASNAINLSDTTAEAIRTRILNQTPEGATRDRLAKMLNVRVQDSATEVGLEFEGYQHTDVKLVGGQKTFTDWVYGEAPTIDLGDRKAKLGVLTSEAKNAPLMFTMAVGSLTGQQQSRLLSDYASQISSMEGTVGGSGVRYSDVAQSIMTNAVKTIQGGGKFNVEQIVPPNEMYANITEGASWDIMKDMFQRMFYSHGPDDAVNKQNLQNYGMGWVTPENVTPTPIGRFSEQQYNRYRNGFTSFLTQSGLTQEAAGKAFESMYNPVLAKTDAGDFYDMSMRPTGFAMPMASVMASEWPGGAKAANYELMAAVSSLFPTTAKNLSIYLGPDIDTRNPTRRQRGMLPTRSTTRDSISSWRDIGLFYGVSGDFQQTQNAWTGDRIQELGEDTLFAMNRSSELQQLLGNEKDPMTKERWQKIGNALKGLGVDTSKIQFVPGTGKQPYLPSFNSMIGAAKWDTQNVDETGMMEVYRQALGQVVGGAGSDDKGTQFAMGRMFGLFNDQFSKKSETMKQIAGGEIGGMITDRYRFMPWLNENEVYLPDEELTRMAGKIAESQGKAGNTKAIQTIIRKMQSGNTHAIFSRYPMESRTESTFGVNVVTDIQAKQRLGVQTYTNMRKSMLGNFAIGVGFDLGEIESIGDFDADIANLISTTKLARFPGRKNKLFATDVSDQVLRNAAYARGENKNPQGTGIAGVMIPDPVQAAQYSAWNKQFGDIINGGLVDRNGEKTFDPYTAARNMLKEQFTEGERTGWTTFSAITGAASEEIGSKMGMGTSYNMIRRLEAGAVLAGMTEEQIAPLIRARGQEYQPYLDRLLSESKPFVTALNSTIIGENGRLTFRGKGGARATTAGGGYLIFPNTDTPNRNLNYIQDAVEALAYQATTPLEEYGSANELLALGFTGGGRDPQELLKSLNEATGAISNDVSTFGGVGLKNKERKVLRANAIAQAQQKVLHQFISGYTQSETERTPALIAGVGGALGREWTKYDVDKARPGAGKELMDRATHFGSLYQAMTLSGLGSFGQLVSALGSSYINDKSAAGAMLSNLLNSWGKLTRDEDQAKIGSKYYGAMFGEGAADPLRMRASRMTLNDPGEGARFIIENLAANNDAANGADSTIGMVQDAVSAYSGIDQTASKTGLAAEEGFALTTGKLGGWKHTASSEGISYKAPMGDKGNYIEIGAHPDFMRWDTEAGKIMALEMKTGAQVLRPQNAGKFQRQLDTQLGIVAHWGQKSAEYGALASKIQTETDKLQNIEKLPDSPEKNEALKNQRAVVTKLAKKSEVLVEQGRAPLLNLAETLGVYDVKEQSRFIQAAETGNISGQIVMASPSAASALAKISKGLDIKDLSADEQSAIKVNTSENPSGGISYTEATDMSDKGTYDRIMSGPGSVMSMATSFIDRLMGKEPLRPAMMNSSLSEAVNMVKSSAWQQAIQNASTKEQRVSLEKTQAQVMAMQHFSLWSQRNPSLVTEVAQPQGGEPKYKVGDVVIPHNASGQATGEAVKITGVLPAVNGQNFYNIEGSSTGLEEWKLTGQGEQFIGPPVAAGGGGNKPPNEPPVTTATPEGFDPNGIKAAGFTNLSQSSGYQSGNYRFTRIPTANLDTEINSLQMRINQFGPQIIAGSTELRRQIEGQFEGPGASLPPIEGGIGPGLAGPRLAEIADKTDNPGWLNSMPGPVMASRKAAELHQTAARIQQTLIFMPEGEERTRLQTLLNTVLDTGANHPLSMAMQDLEPIYRHAQASKGFEALVGIKGRFMDLAAQEISKPGGLAERLQTINPNATIPEILADKNNTDQITAVMGNPEAVGGTVMAMKALKLAGKNNQFIDPTMQAIGNQAQALKDVKPELFHSDIIGEKAWKAADPEGYEASLKNFGEASKAATVAMDKLEKSLNSTVKVSDEVIKAQQKSVDAHNKFVDALGAEVNARKELMHEATLLHPEAFENNKFKGVPEAVAAGTDYDSAIAIDKLNRQTLGSSRLTRQANAERAMAVSEEGEAENNNGLQRLTRRMFGGFGLMYMRSLARIAFGGIGAGSQEVQNLNSIMTMQAGQFTGAGGVARNQGQWEQNNAALYGMGIAPLQAMGNAINFSPLGTLSNIVLAGAAGGSFGLELNNWASGYKGPGASLIKGGALPSVLGMAGVVGSLAASTWAKSQDYETTGFELGGKYGGAYKFFDTAAAAAFVLNPQVQRSALQKQALDQALSSGWKTGDLQNLAYTTESGLFRQGFGSPNTSSQAFSGQGDVLNSITKKIIEDNPYVSPAVASQVATTMVKSNLPYDPKTVSILTNQYTSGFTQQVTDSALSSFGVNQFQQNQKNPLSGSTYGYEFYAANVGKINLTNIGQFTEGAQLAQQGGWGSNLISQQQFGGNRFAMTMALGIIQNSPGAGLWAQQANTYYSRQGLGMSGGTTMGVSAYANLTPQQYAAIQTSNAVSANQTSLYGNLLQSYANSTGGTLASAQSVYGNFANASQATLVSKLNQQQLVDQFKTNLAGMGVDDMAQGLYADKYAGARGSNIMVPQRAVMQQNLSMSQGQSAMMNFGMSGEQANQYQYQQMMDMFSGKTSMYKANIQAGAMNFDKFSMTQAQAYGWVPSAFSGGYIPGQVIQGDVNMQGMVTGQGLFTTSMNQGNPIRLGGISGAQTAASMWGSNWATSGSAYSQGMKNAMVNGYAVGTGGKIIGGSIGAAAYNEQTGYELSMAGIGNQMAQLNLNYAFTTGVGLQQYAGIVNPQTGKPFGFNTGQFSVNVPGAGSYTSTGGGMWGLEDAQRNLGYIQQNWQFGFQQRQINLQSQQFQENQALNWTQMTTQRGWQKQDYAYQDLTRNEQFRWKQEDFTEEVRFMTGRQRRLAERDIRRETTLFNQETGQIDRTRSRDEQSYQWEIQRFDLENKHFQENKRMQQESLDMDKKFFEQRKILEQQQVDLSRAEWTKNIELQKASIGIQAQQIQNEHERAKLEQDIQAKIIETDTLAIDYQKQLGDGALQTVQDVYSWLQKIEALTGGSLPGLSNSGTPGTSRQAPKPGQTPNQPDSINSINTSGVWNRTVVTNQTTTSGGSSSTPIVQVFIGNEQIHSFIVKTVEKEIVQ